MPQTQTAKLSQRFTDENRISDAIKDKDLWALMKPFTYMVCDAGVLKDDHTVTWIDSALAKHDAWAIMIHEGDTIDVFVGFRPIEMIDNEEWYAYDMEALDYHHQKINLDFWGITDSDVRNLNDWLVSIHP
jgi:hypothetical protein